VSKSNYPGGDNLTAQQARSLGQLKIRFDVREIIRHPELDPVIIDG
jgi:hypothetical protein